MDKEVTEKDKKIVMITDKRKLVEEEDLLSRRFKIKALRLLNKTHKEKFITTLFEGYTEDEANSIKELRKRLAKMGIKKGLPVVFTSEIPDKDAVFESTNERNKKSTVGTISYLPPLFGCYLASYVIRKLTGK